MFDFIERNLKDSLEQGNTTESFARYFIKEEGEGYDRDQLHYTIRDLLLAGTETSTTTLLWAFAFVASRPEVQKRLQQEIDSVVGTGCAPSYDDRSKMPYVEAFILELMRLKTLVPLSIPHATYRDARSTDFTSQPSGW